MHAGAFVVSVALAAVGEPQDGFPSWSERVGLVWVNRARADPQADLASCAQCAEKACYEPVPPLAHDHNLTRAARFHAANLELAGAPLQHDSPCTLVDDISAQYDPGPCDGSPACACVGGTATCSPTCTSWTARIGAFGAGPSAENAAWGLSDPVDVFYLWFHEPDSDSSCGWRLANGHRYNILGGSSAIGIGHYGSHWVQDFGGGSPAKIVAGAHYPESGTVAFRANWYDAADAAMALVNIDGTCTPMVRERGANPGNATYLLDAQAISGCKHYFFIFEDAGGARTTYPETGSFGIGCGADWDATRPATGAGCGAPVDPDAGGGPGGPDAGGGGGDGGGGLGDDGGAGGGGDNEIGGGCGCRAARRTAGSGWGAALLLAIVLARRARLD